MEHDYSILLILMFYEDCYANPSEACLLVCAGIGIDDMFVIVQCWTNMKRDPLNQGLSIADKMGLALKHAGVSVTVTSLTDVFAFGVGAVTVRKRVLSKHS